MSDKKKHRTANELLQYLKGAVSGEERHSLEREMEAEPFLKEAMEGFDQVTPDEVESDLVALHQSLRRRRNRNRRRTWYGMAAAVASILIVGTLFLKIYDIQPAGDEKRDLLEETVPGEVPAATEQVPVQAQPSAEVPETEQPQPTIDESEPAQLQPAAEHPETEQPQVAADVPEPAGKGIQAEPVRVHEEKAVPMQPVTETGHARRANQALEKSAAPAPEAAAVEQENVEIVAVEAAATRKEMGKGEPPMFPDEISGTVVSSEDHSPVAGAFLSANGVDAISVTDMKGGFSIPVTSDTQTLISARFPGMEEKKISVPADEPVTIMLQPESLPAREKSLYAVKESSENDEPGRSGLQPLSPTPLGGYIAFYQYVQENKRIPSRDSAGTGGVVILKLNINTLGEISEIVPVSSPGQPFTEEATRLLKEGPRWIPAFDESGTIEQEVTLRIVLE